MNQKEQGWEGSRVFQVDPGIRHSGLEVCLNGDLRQVTTLHPSFLIKMWVAIRLSSEVYCEEHSMKVCIK